ncbi:PREDICTED: dynein heavy chain 2, axonemal [Drosophila arizonae]|uniref:Dynein heavy chain 2, axonemal n=1 Tax=Drosophila arizonae TaxID=7263 RepID=A0ABM1NV32_DROAR|nr:PREDICTED: dynein heavy chain 2, axonemal [Drosophila arizonae]
MTSSSAVEDEHLTDSDLSDDEERKEEVPQEEIRPPTPRPTYSDEDLNQLLEYIQRMTTLYSLNQTDWSEASLDNIRRWLLEVNEPLLTIFYADNVLTAYLGFPTKPVDDISYFLRGEPNEIFTVEGFHDEIHFGTVHSDVDGCLMRLLERFYAPIFRNYQDWNQTVRSRFCASLDKLLAFLFAINSKIGGITALYVPFALHQIGGEQIVCDRPLFKNLESIAVYWTTQIRTVLSDRTLMAANTLATMNDEYEFWEYRLEVLQGLNSQLEQFDVQRVFKVLRQWQSVHMPQIEELLSSAQLEQELATSNLRYLYLLIEPCAKIDESKSLADVSQQLPHIFHLLRFVWEQSEHYKSSDRITTLFRNLSNQIIKYCTSQINLDEILEGRPRLGIKMCNLSLECCQSYEEQLHQLDLHKIGWKLDRGIILNHVHAFMERLNDLKDICEAMIVFGRMDELESIGEVQFSGTNGEQLERIAVSVEQQFLTTLDQLRSSNTKHLMLDVYRSEWYEKMEAYRKSVRGMEETQQRLLSNAFRRVSNVEETLETLNVLLYYSYHATLRKCYLGQVTRLWQRFSEDMDTTTRQLLQLRRKQHLSWLPPHVSDALAYRINLDRLIWLRDRLAKAGSTWLPAVPQAATVMDKFELLRSEFEREIRIAFEEWHGQAGSNLCQKLERYLVHRSKQSKVLLECNMDASALQLCSQAQHFEKLGYALPLPIRKIYEKQDALKLIYNNVLRLCLDYNRLVNSLTQRERKLFRSLIQCVDRQFAPGIYKLSYAGFSTGEPDESYDHWLADCVEHVEELRHIIQLYKRANRQIVRCCERICDTSMLRFNFNGAVDISVFEQQLSSCLNGGNSALRKYYNTIVELITAVANEFAEMQEEQSSEWHQYVNVFDDMLASAFLCCARNALQLLQDALRSDEDLPPGPILVMEADVKDSQIQLTPDMRTVGAVLRGVIDRVQSLVDQFARLGYKLKIPKEKRRPNFARAFREDAECSELVRGIEAEIARQQEKIEEYVIQWRAHHALWELTEEAFTQRLLASSKTARVFEGGIEHYSSLADDISFMDAIAHVHFVLINQNPIKSTLLDWIEKWQALNIQVMLQHATGLIEALYRYMERNERKVLRVPRTHNEAIVANQLFERLVQAVPGKQSRFTPMLEVFVLLHKYRVPLPDAAREQILDLEANWLRYLQVLVEADEMLDHESDEHKIMLAQQADQFRHILKQFHEDYFSKLPKK